VKQANPGFDLLLSVDWEPRLFRDVKAAVSPPAKATIPSTLSAAPEYLAIPIGNQSAARPASAGTILNGNESFEESSIKDGKTASTVQHRAAAPRLGGWRFSAVWLLVVFAFFSAVIVLVKRLQSHPRMGR
jgi:hypothetical protein